MTVQELIELFIDEHAQEFALWDYKVSDIIFMGTIDEIPDGLELKEVKSIDNITIGNADDYGKTIVINIDTEVY